MSDLVENPEDRFSHNEAHFRLAGGKKIQIKCFFSDVANNYLRMFIITLMIPIPYKKIMVKVSLVLTYLLIQYLLIMSLHSAVS